MGVFWISLNKLSLFVCLFMFQASMCLRAFLWFEWFDKEYNYGSVSARFQPLALKNVFLNVKYGQTIDSLSVAEAWLLKSHLPEVIFGLKLSAWHWLKSSLAPLKIVLWKYLYVHITKSSNL